jgi:hypothetical protein
MGPERGIGADALRNTNTVPRNFFANEAPLLFSWYLLLQLNEVNLMKSRLIPLSVGRFSPLFVRVLLLLGFLSLVVVSQNWLADENRTSGSGASVSVSN